MNWTLCSERLPELKPVSDSVMAGGTIKNPDAWEGLVWFKGCQVPYFAIRTEDYFVFNDELEDCFDINDSDFERCMWADFSNNPFEAAE